MPRAEAQAQAQGVLGLSLLFVPVSVVAASSSPLFSIADCTVAAGLSSGVSSSADDGLSSPWGVAVDASGSLFVADAGNHRVMCWEDGGASGTRVAGTGISADLNFPVRVLVQSDDSLIISEYNTERVSVWSQEASSGTVWLSTETGRPPLGMALDSSGNLLLAHFANEQYVKRFEPGSAAGVDWLGHYSVNNQYDVKIGSDGLAYVLDIHGVIRYGDPATSIATGTRIAGVSAGSDTNQMSDPRGFALDISLGVWVADTGNNRVLKCPGTGEADHCEVLLADLSTPVDVALSNSQSHIYVAERYGHRVLKCPTGLATSTPTSTTSSTTSMTISTSSSSSTSMTTSTTVSTSTSTSSTSTRSSTSTTTASSTTSTSTSSSSTSSSSRSTSTSSTTSSSSSSSSRSTSTSSTTSSSSTSTSTWSTTSSSSTSSSITSTSTSSTTSSSSTSSSTTSTSSATMTSSSSTSSSATSTSTSRTTSSSSTSSSITSTSTSSTTSSSSTSSSTTSTSTSTVTSSSSSSSSLTSTSTSTTSSSSSSSSSSSLTSTSTSSTTSVSSTSSSSTSISTSTTISSSSSTSSSVTSTSMTRTTSSTSGSVTSTTTSTTTSSSSSSSSTTTTGTLSTSTTTSSSSSSSSNSTRSTSTSGTMTSTSTSGTPMSSTVSIAMTTNTADNTSSSLTTTSAGSVADAPPSPEEAVAELLSSVANVSASLLGQLEDAGADQFSAPVEGGSLTALRLGRLASLANLSQDGISLAVEGPLGPVELTLPQTLFKDLPASSTPGDSLAVVVATFSLESSGSLGGQYVAPDASGETAEIQVISVISIDLAYLLSRESLEVSGLQQPILFQVPGVNYSDGLRCAYWKEAEQLWSSDGVGTPDLLPGQSMQCSTNHLSFFAAIREILLGFLETWGCAQFKLLSTEAVRNVFNDAQWPHTQGASACWGVLAMVAAAAAVAVFVDLRRGQSHRWKDEFFLVAAGDPPATTHADAAATAGAGSVNADVGARLAEAPEAEAEEAEAVSQRPAPSLLKGALVIGLAGAAGCLRCMWESSALRDALDEILSSWFEYWSQVRSSCENILAVVIEGMASSAPVAAVCHRATATLVLSSSRRLVAASLGMTNDAVTFVLEDEDLQDFIMASPKEAVVGTRANDWKTSEDQRVAWTALHDTVVHHVLMHTERHTVCGLPEIVLQFLLFHNPFSALFLCDIFHSCKKRVLLMAVDLFGAMALSCVFFNAAGMVRGKPLRSNTTCDTSDKSILWMLGRCAAIATGSVLVSGVPAAIIESLHTKGFRKLDYRGSEKWQKQLRVWAVQDMIAWAFALLYIALCLCFIVVFLASIGSDDSSDWTTAELLALAEDLVVLPVLVAFIVPTMTAAVLHLATRILRTDRETVMRRAHEALLRQTSLMLPIMRV